MLRGRFTRHERIETYRTITLLGIAGVLMLGVEWIELGTTQPVRFDYSYSVSAIGHLKDIPMVLSETKSVSDISSVRM